MKLKSVAFRNSSTCRGETFTADAPLDMADITINGRYPEAGWARNRISHEMVRVLRGSGYLYIRDGEKTKLTEGDVVHVPPGEWFAWGGYMKIIMACSPPFSTDQYEIKEGK